MESYTQDKLEITFCRMLDINRHYPNIEVTVNFIMGDGLPPGHYQSIIELTRGRLDRFYSKGAAYMSPLMSNAGGQELQQAFMKIKNLSRLPVYLYLIQRL